MEFQQLPNSIREHLVERPQYQLTPDDCDFNQRAIEPGAIDLDSDGDRLRIRVWTETTIMNPFPQTNGLTLHLNNAFYGYSNGHPDSAFDMLEYGYREHDGRGINQPEWQQERILEYGDTSVSYTGIIGIKEKKGFTPILAVRTDVPPMVAMTAFVSNIVYLDPQSDLPIPANLNNMFEEYAMDPSSYDKYSAETMELFHYLRELSVDGQFNVPMTDEVKARVGKLYKSMKLQSILEIDAISSDQELVQAVTSQILPYLEKGMPRYPNILNQDGAWYPNPYTQELIYNPTAEFFLANEDIGELYTRVVDLFNNVRAKKVALEDGKNVYREAREILESLQDVADEDAARRAMGFLGGLNPRRVLLWATQSIDRQIENALGSIGMTRDQMENIGVKGISEMDPNMIRSIGNIEGANMIARFLGINF